MSCGKKNCGCSNPCEQKKCISNSIIYEGATLECLGVQAGDDLELILGKVNDYICSIGTKEEICTDCINYCGADILCEDEVVISDGMTLTEVLATLNDKICSIPAGANGLSAYDIWINEGNVGTEQDFLDSLVGAPGIDGTDGTDGVDGVDGVDGNSGFTYFNSGNIDHTWTIGETQITNTDFSLPDDGNYQVHYTIMVDLTTPGGNVEESEVRLYLNNVLLQEIGRAHV